jgi:tRNA (cytidine/uridine-2'-O-)-methyltransferase
MLNIVLYQPEIPQNTGNIGRSVAVLGARLHLIRPFGFRLHDPQFRRAGMDYLEQIELVEHVSWKNFCSSLDASARVILTSGMGKTVYSSFEFQKDDYLVFGRESDGLPPAILNAFPSVKIPMPGAGRSLNVAVSAGIIAFEAARQITQGWQVKPSQP